MQRLLIASLFIYYCICIEKTFTLGQHTIEANGVYQDEIFEGPDWLKDLKTPVGLTKYSVSVKDINGNNLSQSDAYVHHLLIYSKYSRNIPCPELEGENIVLASGADLAYADIPYPYAYKISPGDDWHLIIRVDNPSLTKPLTFQMEYTMILEDWNDNFIQVEGYLNKVTGCTYGPGYQVTQNLNAEAHYFYADFPSSFTGYMIILGGHLHRGAMSTNLIRNSTGEVLYNGVARYNDPNDKTFLTSIDVSFDRVYVELYEPLRIAIYYDCSQNYRGVMGSVFAFVVVTEYIENLELERINSIGYIYPEDIQELPIAQLINNNNNDYNPIIPQQVNNKDPIIRDTIYSIQQETSKDQYSGFILNIGLLGIFIVTLIAITLKKPFNPKLLGFFSIFSIIVLTFLLLYQGK